MKLTETINTLRAAGVDDTRIIDTLLKMDTKTTRKKPPSKRENPAFSELWASLPKITRTRSNKSACMAHYTKALESHSVSDMQRAVALWMASPEAKPKNGYQAGHFVPSFERWLRDCKHESWLDASTPTALTLEVVKEDISSDSLEHLFLRYCREDGASEIQIARWNRAGIEVQKGDEGPIIIVESREGDFKEAFEVTLRRKKGVVWPRSYADRRARANG